MTTSHCEITIPHPWIQPTLSVSILQRLYILRSAKKCRSCILGLCFYQFIAGVLQICCTGTAVDTFSPRTRYCTSVNILRTYGEYRLWDSCGSVRIHTLHQIPGFYCSLKIDKNASSPKCKDPEVFYFLSVLWRKANCCMHTIYVIICTEVNISGPGKPVIFFRTDK